jgi:hypothetical protein
LTANSQFIINNTSTISVPAAANNTPTVVSAAINTANIAGVFSAVIGGALFIYADSQSTGFQGAVSGGAGNATTGIATIQFTNSGNAVPTPYPVGSTITITGTSSALYDGSFDVVASSNNTVSFATTAVGAASGGTITWPGSVSIVNDVGTTLSDLGITAGVYATPEYQASPSYQNPRWNSTSAIPYPTGSIWQKTNNVNLGTNLVVQKYNSTLGTFVQQNCPVYADNADALYALDPAGGGTNIAQGSTYAQVDPYGNSTGAFMIFQRYITGPTNITGYAVPSAFTSGDTFTISATESGSATLNTATATLAGTDVEAFISAVSAAAVPYVSATDFFQADLLELYMQILSLV